MILKKDSGDEQKFCTTLMEKTVGGIGILNSDLFSDQFFLQCVSFGPASPDAGVELLRQLFLQCRS
jgi:hypothetical protein